MELSREALWKEKQVGTNKIVKQIETQNTSIVIFEVHSSSSTFKRMQKSPTYLEVENRSINIKTRKFKTFMTFSTKRKL